MFLCASLSLSHFVNETLQELYINLYHEITLIFIFAILNCQKCHQFQQLLADWLVMIFYRVVIP